jgi:hypothetical protein
MVTGGPAATVYSPLMTGNRPELPVCYRELEIVNPVVAQRESGNNRDRQDRSLANPLLEGRSPHARHIVFAVRDVFVVC